MHSFTSYFKSSRLLLLLIFSALELPLTYAQQALTVTGTVSSASDGSGMPGVSVKLKGSEIGTSTDINGKYRISVPSANGTLVFTFMGFTTSEQSIAGKSVINVSLAEESRSLSEVVVVGYGTTSKRDLTGSVVSVKTRDLPQAANASIDNMLQGRAAGLNASVRSAQPGGGLNIDVRGGAAPPLYVIDGVPLFNNKAPEPGINGTDLGYGGGVDRNPLSSINPADIESVDVLKDASAAAIYGAAAANGVVFITTKKGKAGQIVTEYRGSYTAQSPKDYYSMLDATSFMQEVNRLSYDYFLYEQKAGPYGNVNPSTLNFTPRFSQNQIAGAGAGTDWLGMLMRDGNINEHNISISGGTDKTKIFSSFNYYGNKAILNNSDFNRYSGKVNLNQQLGNRVNVNLNLSFSNVNSKNNSTGNNSGGQEKYNQIQAAYAFAPNIGIYDTDGTFTRTYDPLITNPAAFLSIDDKLRTNRFFASPNIEVKISDNLKLNTVVGVDRQSSQRNFYLPRRAENYLLPEGMAQIAHATIGNYSGESYLSYNKKFANSTLSLVGGAGYYWNENENYGLQAVGFFTDAFEYNNVAIASNKEKSSMSSWKNPINTKISQFFRANYSLKDKYLFSVVGRHDGSSYFAPNKKWGFFPGASAAWRISEENFLKDFSALSNLKFRLGYGSTGNEVLLGTGSNTYYGAVSGAGYVIGGVFYPGVGQISISNDNLSWETDITINAGLDYGFFNNRLSGAVDMFRREAKNLLFKRDLPANNAVGKFDENGGSTRSDGLEFSLNSNNFVGKFTWNTTFNIATYKNYWKTRNSQVVLSPWQSVTDPRSQAFGWKTDGIIKSTSEIPSYMPNAKVGNIKYVDANGDNKLDGNDVVKLGNWDPKWSFGFGNTFAYKGFDLNVFLYGRLKQLMSDNYAFLYDPGRLRVTGAQNALVGIRDVWSAGNTSGTLPGVAPNEYSGNNPSGTNDFYLKEVNFLRLRNVTVGYTFANKLIQKQKVVRSARLFLDIQNLGVITNYKGYDPEFTEANPYPQALSTTFGVNLSF